MTRERSFIIIELETQTRRKLCKLTASSLETMTIEAFVLGRITEEKGMIKGMKKFPVLGSFTSREKAILEATENQRIWLIATFFDKHLIDAGVQLRESQKSYNSVCDSKNGSHFSDPNRSEGGAIAEAVDRNALLLDHSSHRIDHLIIGKERFMQQLDKYGFCQECGDPIFLRRLELCPHSGHCVSCKERLNGG